MNVTKRLIAAITILSAFVFAYAPASANVDYRSPANGSTVPLEDEIPVQFNLSVRPTCMIEDTCTLTGFKVQTSTTASSLDAFLQNMVYDGTVGPTATSDNLPGYTFTGNTLYYWRVIPITTPRSTPTPTPKSATPRPPTPPGPSPTLGTVWSFRTNRSRTPTLYDPPNGSTALSLNPLMVWNGTSDATTYALQLSTSSTFASIAQSKRTADATPYIEASTLLEKTKYFWRVATISPAGQGAWSKVFSFQTPDVPSVPRISSPANGATVARDFVKLTWSASTSPAANGYHLQMASSKNFELDLMADMTIGETTFDFYPQSNALVYWRVRASAATPNGEIFSAWSPVSSFRPARPAPPVPIVEQDSSMSLPRTLRWQPSEGATGYTVEIDVASASPVHLPLFCTAYKRSYTLAGQQTDSYTITSLPVSGRYYYWRVRANSAYGPSIWSIFDTYSNLFAYQQCPAYGSECPSPANPPVACQ